jgi:DNA-binding NarL/FixJ family response regulator
MEEKLKKSFSNIKKDISSLKDEIEAIKTSISKIEAKIPKKNFLSSTGNKGVINNHQQSTVINTPKKQQNILQIQEKTDEEILDSTVDKMKKELEKTFKNLTDREFSVFLAIYELENQLDKVTYTDISKQLSLTEMTIRSYVSSLLNKGLPIQKTRRFNNKVSLSIKKEFKTLNLASQLLTLRNSNFDQKTLFSNY